MITVTDCLAVSVGPGSIQVNNFCPSPEARPAVFRFEKLTLTDEIKNFLRDYVSKHPEVNVFLVYRENVKQGWDFQPFSRTAKAYEERAKMWDEGYNDDTMFIVREVDL